MPDPIPVDLSQEPEAFLPYQFHQIAWFCQTDATVSQAKRVWRDLGFTTWTHDKAELKGLLHGDPVVTRASMWFAYGAMPMELELLQYDGPSRHARNTNVREPFVSHMSAYVDDVREVVQQLFDKYQVVPYHRFITQNHTNPLVAGKKRFIEAIYDTRPLLGHDVKFIQKVPHDYDDAEWLDWGIPTS